jgi:molecular chaperone GrpE
MANYLPLVLPKIGLMESNEENEILDNETNDTSAETRENNQESEESSLEQLSKELEEQKEKYLRLFAEFDNFKRRTAKERIDTIKTAGQEVIKDLLSVIDDFERAEKSIEKAKEVEALKDGFLLIKEKLIKSLQSKGLNKMEITDGEFNADFHEAITEIPAPTEEMKGKIIDVVEPGYLLHDKIIRYAKVVVGK